MTISRNVWAAVLAVVTTLALIAVLMFVPANSAGAANEGVCAGLTSGKIDVTNKTQSVTITAPEGNLITQYCVKAGSESQGDGPVYVNVVPPAATVTFSYPGGKDISHYSYAFAPVVVTPPPSEEPTTEPPTPTETPTVTPTPTETPTVTPSVPTPTVTETVTPPVTPQPTVTVTPEVPTETVTETPNVPTPTVTETVKPEPAPEKEETPVSAPNQPSAPNKPAAPSKPAPNKDVQVTQCVEGVFVTTVNGVVISESGTCNEATSPIAEAPAPADQEGL